jgi:hypothetical protein
VPTMTSSPRTSRILLGRPVKVWMVAPTRPVRCCLALSCGSGTFSSDAQTALYSADVTEAEVAGARLRATDTRWITNAGETHENLMNDSGDS